MTPGSGSSVQDEGTVLAVGDAARGAAVAVTRVAPAVPASGAGARATALYARVVALPLQKKLLLGVSALFLLVVLVLVVLAGGRPRDDMRVLFSNVNDRDGAAIVAALQQMNVSYRFTEGGGAILVPAGVVHETRLKLAGQGLPKAGGVGFELLENQRLGTSQFVEQINYQRGLEGELSKTVQSVTQVKGARVHLAIPKNSAFVREQQKPTASVVLTLHPGRFLDEGQVTAITHLVSSAVPQLTAQAVTVMDADGNLLAPNPSRMGASGLDATQLRYVTELEGTIAKRISTILEPIAGRDSVRAQVSVEMDFSQVDRTEETFRPNSSGDSSIRSTQALEASGPVTTAGGIPGALTNVAPQPAEAPVENRPPTQQSGTTLGLPLAGGAAGTTASPSMPATTSANRRENTVNYEVDRAVQTTRAQRGQVKRVSAAVLVNYKRVVDRKGNVAAKAFDEAELKQINLLVRDAMGYSQQRGDSVSVANIPFSAEPVEDVPFWKNEAFLEINKEFWKFALLLGIGGFLVLGVVRPILFPPPEPEADVARQMEEEFDEKLKAELASLSPAAREKRRLELEVEAERRRLEEEDKRLQAEAERARAEEDRKRQEEERKRLDEEKQKEYEELMVYAKEYVQKDPRVVAAIFKDWLSASKDS